MKSFNTQRRHDNTPIRRRRCVRVDALSKQPCVVIGELHLHDTFAKAHMLHLQLVLLVPVLLVPVLLLLLLLLPALVAFSMHVMFKISPLVLTQVVE